MIYALHEALALVIDEGIENRVQRHIRHGAALQAGLEAMGLVLHAQKGHRLSTLTSVRIPEGIEDAKFRQKLLNEYSIEIGGGLGPLKGKIWRIGLMGHSSTQHNIILVLSAMEKLLQSDGFNVDEGAGVSAALKLLSKK